MIIPKPPTSLALLKFLEPLENKGIWNQQKMVELFLLTDFLPSSKTHRFWWGGVGWGGDVNVHWHLPTYVMLRHCTFFCNFHTYVMLRHCTFFCNFHTHTWCYATARSSATSTHTWCYATVLIRLRASWRRKNAERVVDGKVKPSSSETPFFQSKLTFRYGETII